MKAMLLAGLLVFAMQVPVFSDEQSRIVIIDSTTPTDALLPKPGSYLGERFLFEQEHGDETLVRVGVWEAGAGKTVIKNFPFTEYVLMISWKVVVTELNGQSRTFSAGDTFVIPKGWSGDWDI